MQLYFSDDVYNLIFICAAMVVLVVVNHLLNLVLNTNDSVPTSVNLTGYEVIQEFAKDYNIEKIEVIDSPNLPEFDAFSLEGMMVYLNSRCYHGKSLASFFQTVLLLGNYELYHNDKKSYKYNFIVEPIISLMGVLGWAVSFFGLLLHINTLIIIGLLLIISCYILLIIGFKGIKGRLMFTKNYLTSKLNEAEVKKVDKMLKFELLKYCLKPLLSLSRILTFLLPKNQRRSRKRIDKGEPNG